MTTHSANARQPKSRRAPSPARPMWIRLGLAITALAAGWALWHRLSASQATGAMVQLLVGVPLLLLLALVCAVLMWPWVLRARTRAPVHDIDMDWPRLSQLASRFFDAHGLVREQGNGPWAESADLMLRKGTRRYLIQASLWRAARVDAVAVHQLAGDVARRGAEGGVLLCASDAFTAAAHQLARERGILLLHPAQLQTLPEVGIGATSAAGLAPALRVPELPASPAPAAVPVLRPDDDVWLPRDFMPTEPAARAPLLRPDDDARIPRDFMPTVPAVRTRQVPVLRSDDEVRVPREFMPTAPMSLSDRAALGAL